MSQQNAPDILRLYKKTASRFLACLLAAGIAAAPLSALPAQASSFEPSGASSTSPISLQNNQNLPISAAAQSTVTYPSLNPPAYSNKPYVTINKNKPKFTSSQLKVRKEYEKYSALDKYGRAQAAIACLGRKTIPTEKFDSRSDAISAGYDPCKICNP